MVTLTRKSLLLAGAVAVASPTLQGCESTEGGGAVIGAILGGAIMALAGGDAGEIAAAAAVGAAVGYVAGSYVESEKQNYVNEEAFYNAEIASARRTNIQLSNYDRALKSEIASLDKESRRIRTDMADGKITKSEMEPQIELVEQQLETLEQRIEEANETLNNKEHVLADIRHQTSQGTDYAQQVAQLEKEIETLEDLIESLEQHTQSIASIRNRLTI